jgi:hypothetical protein
MLQFIQDHMIWTAYLDESCSHNSPTMFMGGHLGNTEQWNAFNPAWDELLKSEGIQFCHAKDLRNRKKQFQGWSPQMHDAFILKAYRVIASTLQFGATTIIRQDDYEAIYKTQPNPSRLRKDTKYGVLFRGCLQIMEGAVARSALATKDVTLNFVLESGHKNFADAPRLFEVAKKNHLPNWDHLLGTQTFGNKTWRGLQAADLLVYYASILERKNHSDTPSDVEQSPHVLPPGETGTSRYREYRMPITRETLKHLAADFLLPPEQWANMQSK